MAQALGHLICISDHDQIVAAGGPKQQEYQGKSISKELEEAIRNRDVISADSKDRCRIPVVEEEKEQTGAQIIQPIIAAGDAIGEVVILNKKDSGPFTETEKKLAQIAAGFLGRQMES